MRHERSRIAARPPLMDAGTLCRKSRHYPSPGVWPGRSCRAVARRAGAMGCPVGRGRSGTEVPSCVSSMQVCSIGGGNSGCAVDTSAPGLFRVAVPPTRGRIDPAAESVAGRTRRAGAGPRQPELMLEREEWFHCGSPINNLESAAGRSRSPGVAHRCVMVAPVRSCLTADVRIDLRGLAPREIQTERATNYTGNRGDPEHRTN